MARYEKWSDAELIEELGEYDSAFMLTDWEADFFDTVLKQDFSLSAKQRAKIIQIIRKNER